MLLRSEPTAVLGALGELARQVVPMLIIFGLIHWTDMQIAAVFAVLSAGIKMAEILLTRSQVVPNDKANSQIQTAIEMPSNATVPQVIAKEHSDSMKENV